MEPQKPDSLACSPTRYVYVDETRRRLGRLPDDIGACLDIAKAPPRLHLHTVRDKSICPTDSSRDQTQIAPYHVYT